MGKKKRQVDHTALAEVDSSDSNEESQTKVTGVSCLHVSKAIHLVGVKKVLRNDDVPQQCVECSRGNNSKLFIPKNSEASLFICLKCGHYGCSSGQNHAEHHSRNRQSDVHDLALNTMTWIVWCFKCNVEIPSNSSKKLLECVEYVKKYAVTKNNVESSLSELPTDMKLQEKNNNNNNNNNNHNHNHVSIPRKGSNMTISVSSINKSEPKNSSCLDSLPKVRGLTNLGNTCFFNAVLQCLAQTPFLVPVLEEIKEGGEKFKLPGGEIQINEEKIFLEPMEGTLSEWGPLTKTLVETLSELQSGKPEVLSPQKLLTLLHTKCSQFAGFDQHDSHELLRQLLEMVRTEDLMRYQKAILEKFNLAKKSMRENVSDEVRKKLGAYRRQANDLMLRPEQVFRGFLVSTLECQECHNTSEHVESFLDLSLPVMADKPIHIRRKSNSEEGGELSPEKPSKHQLKKMRKQATKNRRAKNRVIPPTNAAGDTVIVDENIKNSSDSDNQDQSDADVEDNAEVETDNNRTQDVTESGYSSEKHVNGDSTCGSPASETNVHLNRDSAIASPVTSYNLVTNKPTDQVLDLTIPDNSLSKDNTLISSPGSQASMACQPSPLTSSSEMNLECRLSPADQETESGPHSGRPASRFDYIFRLLENSSDFQQPCIKNNGHDQLETNDDINLTPLLDCGNRDKMTALENEFRKMYLEVTKKEKPENILNVYDENDENEDSSSSKLRDNWGATMTQRNQVESPGECTVHSCLNQFTAKELMTGNNKVGCDSCSRKFSKGKEGKTILTNASKQLLISSPPAILILHLKRFQVVSFTFRKKTREVKFPMVFDLTPYCSLKCKDSATVRKDQTELLYSLYGVVEHMGTLHGGHYVAYVKVREPLKKDDPRWSFLPSNFSSTIAEKTVMVNSNQNGAVGGTIEPPPGKWYYVSDSLVSEVKEENVLRSQAYLLFYERFW